MATTWSGRASAIPTPCAHTGVAAVPIIAATNATSALCCQRMESSLASCAHWSCLAFYTKSGPRLTDQGALLQGERITEVGPAAQVKIPAEAQVIDLSQATVLPGLSDAHTHMFNNPKPGMSRETSTLIGIHNLQADLRA